MTSLKVQMVPQVAVGQVLQALGLEHIGMVCLGLVEDAPQGMHLCEVLDGFSGVCEWEPDAIFGSESGVAVDNQTERARQ